MQKYTFLVFHKEYEAFLSQLREAGVVHVNVKAEGEADNAELQDKLQRISKLRQVIAQVSAYLPEETEAHDIQGEAISNRLTPSDYKSLPNVEDLLSRFEQLTQEKTRLEQALQQTERDAEKIKVWGDFSTDKLQALRKAGYNIQAFAIEAGKYDPEWETLYNAFVHAKVGGKVYFITVNHLNEGFVLDAEELPLPERNYSAMLQDVQNLKGLLVKKEADLQGFAIANLKQLQVAADALQAAIDWQKVELATDKVADEKLCLLEGYCPTEKAQELNAVLDKANIYYIAEEPTEEDATPVQLNNGFFARLFEPITRLYALPNYMEIDPTPFFAPFFMLFFGLCLGDGGYGLLILAVGLYLILKQPKMREWGWLAIFCGTMTMICGILTGMFFGVELENVAFLKPVKEYFITDNNFQESLGGYSPMMVFAIAIGVVQILFAMGFKVVKITMQKGFKYALYDLGWLVFLLAGIALAAIMMADLACPAWGLYTIYGIMGLCALFILFYSDPDRKILILNLGGGLWGTYNMISGLLGDVLSYIRLFALGLAGGILGNVFNQLAIQAGSGLPAWIGWLPMILIMVFGHGLNFALSLISAVVHPLRLTFVEFYKNAGFEGGGREYTPFR